jgi:hypothetical protein
MHFGKWIVVAFVVFAIFIATLVTFCVREDISLVSKNYYNEELQYEQQLQRLNNTEALQHKPLIEFTNQELKITWDKAIQIEKGEVNLFCPSNANLDKQFELQHSSEQTFTFSSLKKGLYKVKLLWSASGKEYYIEKTIFIG